MAKFMIKTADRSFWSTTIQWIVQKTGPFVPFRHGTLVKDYAVNKLEQITLNDFDRIILWAEEYNWNGLMAHLAVLTYNPNLCSRLNIVYPIFPTGYSVRIFSGDQSAGRKWSVLLYTHKSGRVIWFQLRCLNVRSKSDSRAYKQAVFVWESMYMYIDVVGTFFLQTLYIIEIGLTKELKSKINLNNSELLTRTISTMGIYIISLLNFKGWRMLGNRNQCQWVQRRS